MNVNKIYVIIEINECVCNKMYKIIKNKNIYIFVNKAYNITQKL